MVIKVINEVLETNAWVKINGHICLLLKFGEAKKFCAKCILDFVLAHFQFHFLLSH